ncbi:uncharacterized protein NPIL_199491 [Nephila pilipes]|uniref:Uncharacterized protein n=2 Tax=Arthropoda TaxID=6656 RepID=A0A8X6T976_NEPPI|nr:uncharacterized protein NPIL_199491 [Nephila pilipes]
MSTEDGERSGRPKEVSNPPENTQGCSYSTQNVSTADSLSSASVEAQRTAQPRPGHNGITLVDQTNDSASQGGPLPTQFSLLDIETILGNCNLKSEDIPCLMGEKLPSSESDENIDSFHDSTTIFKHECKNILPISVTVNEPSCSHKAVEPNVNLKQQEDMLQSWLAGSSDDSTFNPIQKVMEQLLIDTDNDSYLSEMDKISDIKGNTKETQTETEQPVVGDLIKLCESQEEITETPSTKKTEQEQQFLQKSNQISDFQTEKCARQYMEHLKEALNNSLPLPNPIKPIKTTRKDESNGLKTVEEELQDAESNSLKRTSSRSLAEMGLRKLDMNNPLRITVNDGCLKNIKKIGVYQNIYQGHLEKSGAKCEGLDVNVTCEGQEKPYSLDSRDNAAVESNITVKEVIVESPEKTSDVVSMENKESTPEDTTSDCKGNKELPQKLFVEIPPEEPQEITMFKNDSENDEKKMEIKSILKNQQPSGQKRVSFVEKKGDLGMEHMGMHQEDGCTKIQETQPDLDITLRFITETYPSREEEEMMSESLTATLEPSVLARSRKESPRATEIYEEIKILEGEENLPKGSSIMSPERPKDKSKDRFLDYSFPLLPSFFYQTHSHVNDYEYHLVDYSVNPFYIIPMQRINHEINFQSSSSLSREKSGIEMQEDN